MNSKNQNGSIYLNGLDLSKYVHQELMGCPKMGVNVSIENWLSGPLRDWAESSLSESRLKRDEYFNPSSIQQKWEEHMSVKRNWRDCLMFHTFRSEQ